MIVFSRSLLYKQQAIHRRPSPTMCCVQKSTHHLSSDPYLLFLHQRKMFRSFNYLSLHNLKQDGEMASNKRADNWVDVSILSLQVHLKDLADVTSRAFEASLP